MADAPALVASVVIPTRNRPELLAEAISDLSAQDLGRDRYEIIVVDDGSDRVATVPGGIRLIRTAHRGVSAARNIGAREAAAELVCFVDDDVSVPPQWLRELVLGAERFPEALCFGGPIRVRMEARTGGWLCRYCAGATRGESELELDAPEGVIGSHVNGGNMGIRKRALAEAGAFDESVPAYGEETEWEDRLRAAGGQIVYLPEAWLWHRRTAEHLRFRSRLTRSFRGGLGNGYYARSIGDEATVGARDVLLSAAHVARRRCKGGLLHASYQAGFVTGRIRFAARTRRTRI
ncbi:MAG TPA: glycosyltransferase [Gaiellaceae bacterium]|jgi:GT2 family glycosyltransferase|nr:glycosyltransferase [Gaiellaceae bacterium]